MAKRLPKNPVNIRPNTTKEIESDVTFGPCKYSKRQSLSANAALKIKPKLREKSLLRKGGIGS